MQRLSDTKMHSIVFSQGAPKVGTALSYQFSTPGASIRTLLQSGEYLLVHDLGSCSFGQLIQRNRKPERHINSSA